MKKPDKKPAVSVIIPTYNRAWIVQEAIRSVLAQTFSDYELIVVDDGSTDSTQSILTKFQDEITVIRQENTGVSAARNHGVNAARGELIAFLDSDDLWLPDKLAVQVEFFSVNPDTLICQTDEIWIRNGLRINPKAYHQKPSGDIFLPSLFLCLVSPSAVMMKKDFFSLMGGFDESLPACEDYDLWLRIGCRYPVPLIPHPLVIKRGGHEDQLSRKPGLDRYRIVSLHRLLESGNLSPVQVQKAVDVLNRKIEIYANGCMKRGKAEEAAHIRSLAKEGTLSRAGTESGE
jgi:glycosyltransferase involved in cell wall biosynthesis